MVVNASLVRVARLVAQERSIRERGTLRAPEVREGDRKCWRVDFDVIRARISVRGTPEAVGTKASVSLRIVWRTGRLQLKLATFGLRRGLDALD
jgi:hypothetical protein